MGCIGYFLYPKNFERGVNASLQKEQSQTNFCITYNSLEWTRVRKIALAVIALLTIAAIAIGSALLHTGMIARGLSITMITFGVVLLVSDLGTLYISLRKHLAFVKKAHQDFGNTDYSDAAASLKTLTVGLIEREGGDYGRDFYRIIQSHPTENRYCWRIQEIKINTLLA